MSTIPTMWRVEMLWHLATALIAILIGLPLFVGARDFPFLVQLIVLAFVFLTLTRYLFLLSYSPFATWQRGKFLLAALCIPVLFLTSSVIAEFQIWFDQKDVRELLPTAASSQLTELIGFARTAIFLFGAGGFLAALILPVRMVRSLWRTHNKGRR